MTEARFDDVSVGPAGSFRFVGLTRIIEAAVPAEVGQTLADVEKACAAGLWAAGYVAYEAAPGLDPHLAVRARQPEDPFAEMPLAWFGLFEGWEEADPIPAGAYSVSPWRASVSRDRYTAAIERIRGYIRAGDTYQVNHTFRLRADLEGTDPAFYADLLATQRAAHCAYLDTGRYKILSASPEMFFSWEGDRLTARPMKGTAPRGRFTEEDREHAARLVASPKEQAENAMIVDLLRNDMGRIASPSSVRVTKLFETERYETVWQLTSTIESRLPSGTGLSDVMRALFPSGSVTGAPKVRSMEITAELEDSPRGVYTGAIGYVAPAGEPERMFFNVAIRTVALDSQTGIAEFGVGGGITHDSVAVREYEECMTKARVLTERRPEFELFESMRFEGGGFLWLDRHLERLASSASYFDFRFDQHAVREALDALGVREPAKVRLTLTRAGNAVASASELGSSDPVRLAIDDQPVDHEDVFLFHKTTRRDVYERASARHPEADDVVLVNDRGEITEATSSNLLVRIGTDWFTPALDCGLLPGIHRGVLLASGEIRERRITVEEFEAADGIALINSVRLRRDARVLD